MVILVACACRPTQGDWTDPGMRQGPNQVRGFIDAYRYSEMVQ